MSAAYTTWGGRLVGLVVKASALPLHHREHIPSEQYLLYLLLLLSTAYTTWGGGGGRLVGLVVKASASRAEDPVFESRLRRDFSGVESDLKIGTPVATLSGAWRYRFSAGTGRLSVGILWLAETESLVWNSYLSVAARKLVWTDPFLRYTRVLLGR